MKKCSLEFRDWQISSCNFRLFPVFCCLGILLGGCAAQKKAAAIPWSTAVMVRPIVPERTADADEIAATPDIELEIPPPESIPLPRSSPARPRIAPPPPSRETESGKLATPQVVPELSAQESSALQQETEQSLGDAERNVTAAAQKTLNPTQSDLASKVRSFIADARDAGKVGDWSRARDLARKAQVLSQELSRSL